MHWRARTWRRGLAAAVAAAAVLGIVPARAAAQLSVQTLSGLEIGTVITGTGVVVGPTDRRAGHYVIEGPPNWRVRLQFALPPHVSAGAHVLPVAFGPTAAIWSTQDQAATGTVFDPRQDLELRIPTSRRIYIWLGTQLTSSSLQPAGSYQGPLTLTVTRI